jgi:hypothetical protein
MLPLREAKLIHLYDDRWATYGADGATRDLPDADKRDAAVVPLPRYWVREAEVDARLAGRWDRGWLLGWRDITNSTNERTTIAASFPRAAVGNNLPLMLTATAPAALACLAAGLSSLAQDYCARLKVGGSHLNYFIYQQLPVPAPSAFTGPAPWQPGQRLDDWIADRVLELSYTSWAMQPFALDLHDDGPPFRWDPERRAQLRAELDACFFHLYDLDRAEVAHVLDTFPIVRRKDEAAHGEYRTARLVLAAYDAMTDAARAGTAYVSPLDPPPGAGPRHDDRAEVPA